MHRLFLFVGLLAGLLTALPLQGEITVTGSVLARGGAPVAGARADLLPALNGFEAGRLILGGRLEPPLAATAASGADGRFELTAPRSGVWRLVVSAPGFVSMQLPYVALVETRELASVTLPAAHQVRARVLDHGGRPVPGVWVWAEAADPRLWHQQSVWRPHFRAGRTDREGWISLPRAAGEQLRIRVLDGGAMSATTAKGEGVVRIRVGEGTVRRVLEITPESDPSALILVRAGPLDWPAGLLRDGHPLSLAGPADVSWPLQLMTAGGSRQSVEVPASADHERPWAVTPPPTVRFTGRVLDASTGRPLAGSLVWPGADPGAFVHTDDDGRYRLTAPAGDRFWLQAEAAGYRARAEWITPEQAASATTPTLGLTPAVEMRGRVLDAADRALPGARLAAFPRRREATDHASFSLDPADGRTRSGAGGAFRLAGLEPGRAYELRVSRPGYAAVRLQVTAPLVADPLPETIQTRPAPLLVVRLTRGRAAHGRVVDFDERPVADAEVILTAAGDRRPVPDSVDEASEHRGSSDEEGRFTISRLPGEEVEIAVFKEGFAPLVVRGVEIPPATASENGAVDLGTVVLGAAVTLSGRVVDSEGEGLSEVPIFVVPPNFDPDAVVDPFTEVLARSEPSAHTDGGGFFSLGNLAPGDRMHLFAGGIEHVGAWVQHLQVPVTEPLRIVLEPGLGFTGRVVDAAGRAIPGAELQLTWTEHLTGLDVPAHHAGEMTRRSDDEGRFAFSGLRPGPATLDAWAAGFQESEPLALELPSAEGSPDREELMIVLERGATVAGEVKTAAGRSLDGVQVSAGRPGTFSDAEGRYRLDGVAAGTVLVEAYHPHYGRVQKELEVEMDEHYLELTFPDGREIRGLMVDGSGRPLAGASLELSSGERRAGLLYRAHSDIEGRFRLTSVAEGEYQIRARLAGSVLKEPRTLRVAGEDLDDVRVILERGTVVAGSVLGLDFDQLARVRVSAGDEQDGILRGQVDYTGTYEIRDVPPGYWVVRAVLDGGRRQVQERVEVPPGGAEIRRDLSFGERFVLSGTVLLEGEPLPAAQVSLSGRELAVRREVASDHSGRFRIEDLEGATYNLGVAHSRELAVYNRDLELDGDRDLVIDLVQARVGGRVVDADSGQPLAGALVTLIRLSEIGEETNALVTSSDPQGAFDFPRAPPGRYRLSVRREGYAEDTWQLNLTAGAERRDLELEIRATPGAELKVRLASGGVPRSVDIVILDGGGGTVLRQSRPVTDRGEVSLPTVPHGVFRLVVQSPGTVLRQATLEVPGGPLELVLEPAGQLDVQVPDLAASNAVAALELVGPNRQPWIGLDPYGRLVATWRVVGGRASVEGLPPGLWSLRVTGVDGQSWGGTATALPGTRTTVELR